MSKLRPCLSDSRESAIPDPTALLCIYHDVKDAPGLLHGRLDGPQAEGEHCAIGWFFADHPHAVLKTTLVDEVAAVNDSMPKATPKQRRLVVLRWLRWKLAQVGMPGFTTAGQRKGSGS